MLNAFRIASNEAYRLRFVAFEPGDNVGIRVGNCSFTAIRTISNTTSDPGTKTGSLSVTADTSTRNSRLKFPKGVSLTAPNVCNLAYPAPVSARSKCVVSKRSFRRMKVSGRDAPPPTTRDTFLNKSSIRLVTSAIVGLSGVVASMNTLWSGRSQPDTHVSDRTTSAAGVTAHESIRHCRFTPSV